MEDSSKIAKLSNFLEPNVVISVEMVKIFVIEQLAPENNLFGRVTFGPKFFRPE